MTVATLALVAAVVVILVLVALVGRLRGRVDRLATEVDSLRELADRPPTAQQPPAAAPEVAPAERIDEPVPVITGLRTDAVAPLAAEPTAVRVVSVTMAGPIIKVAAFSHGVRQALDDEHRMRAGHAFRKELRRQRKLRRRAAVTRHRQHAGTRP